MCTQNQDESSFSTTIPPQKNADATVVLVYPFGAMKYALASFANLLTLAIGITIGVMLAPHLEKPAQAVSVVPQAAAPLAATPNNGVEQINPTMTVGSIGTYLLLAHHIQSDELVVNGINILKLEQGEINLLARTLGVNPQDVQNIVNDAKVTRLYQVAAPKRSAPINTPHK